MLPVESLLSVTKIIILGAVFFVWVVRYDNIKEEFKKYNYPNWLRDLTGILKISFVLMLFNADQAVVSVGAIGLTLLMTAAFLTHLRVKNSFHLMLPSISMILFSAFIAVYTV